MKVQEAFKRYEGDMKRITQRWMKKLVEEWECDTWTDVMALGKAIYAVGKLLGELHLSLLVAQIDYEGGENNDGGTEGIEGTEGTTTATSC
jgi:hypothetical protein